MFFLQLQYFCFKRFTKPKYDSCKLDEYIKMYILTFHYMPIICPLMCMQLYVEYVRKKKDK